MLTMTRPVPLFSVCSSAYFIILFNSLIFVMRIKTRGMEFVKWYDSFAVFQTEIVSLIILLICIGWEGGACGPGKSAPVPGQQAQVLLRCCRIRFHPVSKRVRKKVFTENFHLNYCHFFVPHLSKYSTLASSVPHVSGPPGSFYHPSSSSLKSKNTLIPAVLWLLLDFENLCKCNFKN